MCDEGVLDDFLRMASFDSFSSDRSRHHMPWCSKTSYLKHQQLQRMFIYKINRRLFSGNLSDTERKISLRFIGRRFDGAILPLNALDDLKYINEMVSRGAKRLYLEHNRNRKKVPKGFSEIALCMSGISEGSAIIDCIVPNYNAQKTITPYEDASFFSEAYRIVVERLSLSYSVPDGETDPYEDILCDYFEKFGKGLRDDESIEFNHDGREYIYDRNTRNRLAETLPKYARELEIYATVDEMSVKDKTFRVSYVDNDGNVRSLGLSYKGIPSKKINEAMMQRDSRRVLLKGVGWFKKKVLNEFDLDYFELLDPRDVQARVDDLTSLKDGWAEERSGKGIDRTSAKMFADYFDEYGPSGCPLPCIFPTIEGGLSVEWDNDRYALTVNLPDLKSILIDLNEDEVETLLDLKDIKEWGKLKTAIEEGYNGC